MSWYLESGEDSDIVLSTRIRLKRNFNDIAFLPKANKEDKEEVFNRMKKAISNVTKRFIAAALIFFVPLIIGLILGGLIGVTIMCMLFINRDHE